MAVIVFSGTIRTSVISMPIVIVAMIIPLLGLRVGLVSAVLTLMFTLGISILEKTGYPLPSYFPRNPLSNWFHLISAFSIVIVPLGLTWKDISNALARARKSEMRYVNLFQIAPVMCLLIREEGGNQIISDCNLAFLKTLGYSNREVINKPLSDFLAPQSQLLLENGDYHLDMDTPFESCMLASDGRIVPTLFQAAPELSEDGSSNTTLAIFIDITERQQAEHALLEEKNFTDQALNSLKDTFFVFDPKTRKAIRWNKALSDISGYRDEEIQTLRTPDDFLSMDDIEKTESSIFNNILNQDFVTEELSLLTKTGETIPTEYTATTIRDDDGQTQYIIAIGRDIRDRKETEIALQKTENKHRLLFEEANDGIFIIQDSRFTDCNTKILEMFRAERKDILGKRPHEISPAFQPNGKRTVEMEQEMLKEALAGERQFFEWKHLRKDNTEFDVEVSLNLLEIDNEKFVQAIVRDITERKQAQN